MAMPRNAFTLGEPFVMGERHEFEIFVKNVGLLRFRFETPTRVYLTLFMVDREKQGKGLGPGGHPLPGLVSLDERFGFCPAGIE